MATVNYSIQNVTSSTFDIVLDTAVAGLTGSNLTISNPSVSVTSMTDTGDNLTYNVVCGALAENVSHDTAIDDGGTNTYIAKIPLVNDVVVVQNESIEMDNSGVTTKDENFYGYLQQLYPEQVKIWNISIEADSEIGLSSDTDDPESTSEFEQLGASGDEFLVDFTTNDFLIRINPSGNQKIKAATAGYTSANGWDENSLIDMFDLQSEAGSNPRVTINYFDVIGQTNVDSVEIETIDSGIFTIRNSRRDEQ